MSDSKFDSVEEFKSQYTGVWNPSDSKWLGLEFSYNQECYRLSTGSMFDPEDDILEDGRIAVFYLYKQVEQSPGYLLIGKYATIDELLESKTIDDTAFATIIISDNTVLLAQD